MKDKRILYEAVNDIYKECNKFTTALAPTYEIYLGYDDYRDIASKTFEKDLNETIYHIELITRGLDKQRSCLKELSFYYNSTIERRDNE